MKKILIACGGTGGHLFPGIAVAQELINRGHQVSLVISKKSIDAQASAKYADLDFIEVDAIAKPATLSFKMIGFLLKLRKAIVIAKKTLHEGKFDVVLGMGGFTSFAPVYAAKKLGLRTFIHDSNAYPGKANLMTSKFAEKVLLGTSVAATFFKNKPHVEVGTPVRDEVRESYSKDESAKTWGLNPSKKTIVIVGGSQGAKGLNTICVEGLSKCLQLDQGLQVLHIAGPSDEERVKGLVGTKLPNYVVLGFCDKMPQALALADLVIARSGASTLTELAYLGKPSLLVPYPYAADDHQTYNAKVFVAAGAAVMVHEGELTEESLHKLVKDLFEDFLNLSEMSEKAKSLAKPDSAKEIASLVVGE